MSMLSLVWGNEGRLPADLIIRHSMPCASQASRTSTYSRREVWYHSCSAASSRRNAMSSRSRTGAGDATARSGYLLRLNQRARSDGSESLGGQGGAPVSASRARPRQAGVASSMGRLVHEQRSFDQASGDGLPRVRQRERAGAAGTVPAEAYGLVD